MSKINYPMDDLDLRNFSSARQVAEAYEKAEKRHMVQTQVFQSQVDTAQLLMSQQKQIEDLNSTMSMMLKLNQALANQVELKESLESRRFWLSTVLSLIAAATGVWQLIK